MLLEAEEELLPQHLPVELVSPNTQAAGARIYVTMTGGTVQMREIVIGSNFTSQNPTVQVFGLGNDTSVQQIRVEWPAIDMTGVPTRPTPTVLDATDPEGRVLATSPGETRVIRHPALPPP